MRRRGHVARAVRRLASVLRCAQASRREISCAAIARVRRPAMDSSRFDRLTRLLASKPTRRNLVRGLFATAAVSAVAQAEPAAAACTEAGERRCRRNSDCCGDNVRCRQNECRCRSGYRICRQNGKNQCVDRRTDPRHCGRCDRRCKRDQVCEGGRCRRSAEGACTIYGFCGAGRRPCCAGFACRAGQPAAGLGGCVPA
jgi:hypothetical protein